MSTEERQEEALVVDEHPPEHRTAEVEAQTDPGQERTETPRRPRLPYPRLKNLQEFATLLIAVAALSLSVVTWVGSNTVPTLEATMSEQLYIQAEPLSANRYIVLYLQPSLFVTRKSDRTAVVYSFSLDVERPDRSVAGPRMNWVQIGQWVGEVGSKARSYQYVSSPQPVTVTQDKPAAPVLMFADRNEPVAAGRWSAELILHRAGGDAVLPFCIDVSDADLVLMLQDGHGPLLYQRPYADADDGGACYESND